MKRSETIAEFLNLLRDCKSEYDYAYEQVGYYDKQKCDLLHQLELEPLTAKERTKLSRELRDCLRNRRVNKDIVEQTKAILDYKLQNSKAIENLKQTLGELRKVEKYHEERTYRKRIAEE